MVDGRSLVADLRDEMRALEADLYQADAGTPGTPAPVTLARQVTLAASAWVVATVFVRFCEDNQLTDAPFLAGSGARLSLARQRQMAYFRNHPERTDRDWIPEALDSLGTSEPTVRMFGNLRGMMSRHPISPDAASRLLAFWRRTDHEGRLVHDFTDPQLHMGFLGDLYQDLSENARGEYALVQTPGFVADLIVGRTVGSAVGSFGLPGLRTIDPVCGSGTFLEASFRLLLDAWRTTAPGAGTWELIRRALSSVHGVDKNPVAVAISRFRLLIAAMRAAGVRRISEIPDLPFTIAAGDSLIPVGGTTKGVRDEPYFDVGDFSSFPVSLLAPGSYDAVTGNPPYIMIRDPDEQVVYRSLYPACRGRCPLLVPFTERLFGLARPGGGQAGYVGMLVSNSFMKREFGRPLIEDFLSSADLTHVLDTSGAYLPGHGVPTVILLGRAGASRRPAIRTAIGRRGEPAPPPDGETGVVWQALTSQLDRPGSVSEWIQVADLDRQRFAKHPWILSGSAETDLLGTLEAGTALGDRAVRIGSYAATGADDAFTAPEQVFWRCGAEPEATITVVSGSQVRDWTAAPRERAFFPGPDASHAADIARFPRHLRRLWPYRTTLRTRRYYGTQQGIAYGRPWYGWHQIAQTPGARPWSLVCASVGTHAHFAVLREGFAPLQSAPVVKLARTASDADFFGLAAVLNSSAACFWLKQYSQAKGAPSADQLRAAESWEHFHEFTPASLRKLPLPLRLPADHGRELDLLASRLSEASPARTLGREAPARDGLDRARAAWERIRGRMIALQEELDWDVYRSYGLVSDAEAAGLVAGRGTVPELRFGQRAFEIVVARRMASGETDTGWFARHGTAPVTEVPGDWPEEYRAMVARRIEVIERNRSIGLIERPEYKRRWLSEPWELAEQDALRDWLLDRCEERSLWYGPDFAPRPQTVARLADRLSGDADVVSAARLLRGPRAALSGVLAEIIADEHVPFLAQYRYKASGLVKRAQWERAWELQRQEDRTGRSLDIPVPPGYTRADFVTLPYWRHRGKLDVPRERFISYPGASPDCDGSLLLGWAGWDHREQAQTLITIVEERSTTDGWTTARLKPLIAGLAEVMPWVRQWHDEVDPEAGVSPADACDAYLTSQCTRHGLTREALRAWEAPPVRRGRPPKKREPGAGTPRTRR